MEARRGVITEGEVGIEDEVGEADGEGAEGEGREVEGRWRLWHYICQSDEF